MIKKFKLVLMLFIGITYGNINAQNPNGNTSNPSDRWTLDSDFSDEFNGNSIDFNKWSRNQNLPNTKAWKWNNNTNLKNVTFKSQKAVEIIARQNANNRPVGITYFNSGCLQSVKQLPKNFVGYVEAKIHGADINASQAAALDKRRGVCPAFWLYSKFFDNRPIGQTVYTEIDIVELQQFDFDANAPAGVEKQDQIDDAESNLHLVKKASFGRDWFRPKQAKARGNQLNKYNLGFDPTKGWHTYGCEITPTKLYFYVDGKRVGKVLNNTNWSDNPMYVIASLGMRVPFVSFEGNVFNPVNPVTNARAQKSLSEMPASMYVDYIRVWKKNGSGGNGNPTPDPDPTPTPPNNGGGNIKVAPNPANNFVTITAPFKSRITISNIGNGNIVKRGKANKNNTLRLRVADLSNGMYTVSITTKGKTVTRKLVIN
ncbi:T9SS type A sorting domain-containing protein [uncultured Algibacter sp.]|uniref:T9SS type A sorting domain-containing protein n=1 Tax=uncultured Algibacter sp. TaxID=298659 RepID=UPI0032163AF6